VGGFVHTACIEGGFEGSCVVGLRGVRGGRGWREDVDFGVWAETVVVFQCWEEVRCGRHRVHVVSIPLSTPRAEDGGTYFSRHSFTPSGIPDHSTALGSSGGMYNVNSSVSRQYSSSQSGMSVTPLRYWK